MPKPICDRGLLTRAEVGRLQRVFDEACRRLEAAPDSAEAHEVALRLLALHNAGMVDEATLVDAASAFRPAALTA